MYGLRAGAAGRRRGSQPAEPRRCDAVDGGHRQFRIRHGKAPVRTRGQSACLGLVGPHRAVRGDRHEYVQPGCLRGTHRAAHRDDEGHRARARTTVSGRRRQPEHSAEHAPTWARRQFHRFADEIITTGATPMLRAAGGLDSAAVRLLLEYGGRVDVPNAMGVTPLMAAAGLGMEPSPRFNPSAKDVQDRSIATLEILRAAGADVNARITDVKSRTARWGRGSNLHERGGQSALYGAVQWAWPRVVQYLIDHGAEVAVVDDRRVSPLDAALGRAGSPDNKPSPEVAKILQTAIGQ